jgi:WD40 repeat protein
VISPSWDDTITFSSLLSSSPLLSFLTPSLSFSLFLTNFPNNKISSLKFTKDGKTVISSSWDDTVKVWTVKSSQASNDNKAHSAIVCKREGREKKRKEKREEIREERRDNRRLGGEEVRMRE